MALIPSENFNTALLALLDETFDKVEGHYLDKGTSLFETLATITAAEASIPVGGKCATLAAQVRHVAFYLQVLERGVRTGTPIRVDWDEIWRTVSAVTPAEWEAIKAELRASYNAMLTLAGDTDWSNADALSGAIAVVAHTAYHLGEIRQALCTLRP